MTYKVINGDNLEILKTYPDNHFDSIVTDPPYGISFLGKGWDEHTGLVETYKECLRVLKPGGHLLAFSAARTYHRLAVSVEDAGFEIRDQIMWIYSSGFPKSQDVGKMLDRKAKKLVLEPTGKTRVSGGARDDLTGAFPRSEETIHIPQTEEAKEWSGWGTQLKPAHEPIVMARKPLKQTIAKNCLEWRTGAINIDDTRIPFEDDDVLPSGGENGWSRVGFSEKEVEKYKDQKKKKSDFEKARDWSPQRQQQKDGVIPYGAQVGHEQAMYDLKGRFPSNVLGEIPEYQKFFYCPKVSRAERHSGFDELPASVNNSNGMNSDTGRHAKREDKANNHPTVKPIKLMEYLIKLVTPPNGHVLDPFNGSGSTGMAAIKNGFEYTGIELDANYCEISRKRIDSMIKEPTMFDELFEFEEEK